MNTPATTEPSTALVPLEQVEDILLHGGQLTVMDPAVVQLEIVKRILSSGSIEEAFAQTTSTPANEIDGRTVQINGIAWMPSAYEDGPPIYMLLDVTELDSGEQLTVSCGGYSVMAAFLWAQRQEAMPFKGIFRKRTSRSDPSRSYWEFALAAGRK